MLEIASIFSSTLTSQVENYLVQKRRNTLLYGILGLFSLTTYILILLGLYKFLINIAEAHTVIIMMGLIFLSLSIITLIGILLLNRRDRRIQKKNKAVRQLASAAAISTATNIVAKKKVAPLLLIMSAVAATALVASRVSGSQEK